MIYNDNSIWSNTILAYTLKGCDGFYLEKISFVSCVADGIAGNTHSVWSHTCGGWHIKRSRSPELRCVSYQCVPYSKNRHITGDSHRFEF